MKFPPQSLGSFAGHLQKHRPPQEENNRSHKTKFSFPSLDMKENQPLKQGSSQGKEKGRDQRESQNPETEEHRQQKNSFLVRR